jgi:hypothetical protein
VIDLGLDQLRITLLELTEILRSAEQSAYIYLPVFGTIIGPFGNDTDDRVALAHAVFGILRLKFPFEIQVIKDSPCGFQIPGINLWNLQKGDIWGVTLLPVPRD